MTWLLGSTWAVGERLLLVEPHRNGGDGSVIVVGLGLLVIVVLAVAVASLPKGPS